jgi:hypothetical protein
MAPVFVIWLHLLCMVGAFGGLLALRVALPADVRNGEGVRRRVSLLLNAMIGVGLLAGAVYYVLLDGHKLGGHFNGVIAVKFVLLLAVGGLLAASGRRERGDGLRDLATALLAVAALAGSSL